MKVISLWQPWASLMAWEEKRNETRSWYTSHRGLLAIHATKTWKKEATEAIVDNYETFMKVIYKHEEVFTEGGRVPKDFKFPHGVILGYCELLDCTPTIKYLDTHSITYKEIAFGNYNPGRFVWKTRWIKTFEEPIPHIGTQSFSNFELATKY